jgi:class 3 adenylate cyclase
MQESVKRYADGVFRSFGMPIQIRVGLNSGEVVVRAIGSDLHMDYTAVGQSTHLAARMEQAAPPGSILVTADTMRLANGYITVKPLGPLAVKGVRERIAAYEVIGAGTALLAALLGALIISVVSFVLRRSTSRPRWRMDRVATAIS